MASEVKTNKISPATGTDVTLGDASDTFTIPASATLDVNGTIDVTGATTTGFPAGGLAGVQAYTSGGTWTKATRESALGITITKVVVEVQGGGGGGHSGSGTAIMGGSGGGYAKKLLDVSSVTSSTITVGAGGGSGVSGGDSSWADSVHTNVVGVKGLTGTGPTATVGGLGTGGDVNIQGGHGGKSYESKGGGSVLGQAGNNYTITSGQSNASGYGGGGGACETFASGSGSGGIVIVWEYQ